METRNLRPVHSRRAFLTRSGLAAGAAALVGHMEPIEQSALAQQQRPAPSGTFRRLSEPVLTNPTPDGVTVLWVTSAPATGWVEYGLTETLGQRATGENQGLMPYDEHAFKIRLKNLRPNTRYYYRVHAVPVDFRGPYDIRRLVKQTSVSEVYSFTTANRDTKEVRFTVWNDTHEVLETLRRLHEAHQKNLGDFLLWNGDQTNDISTEERMIGQFLSPAGNAFATKVPYYYVRGNHDVRGFGARHLPRYSDVPDNVYYYSFRRGPMAALVLDTGEDKPDDHPVYGGLNDFAGLRTRQVEWLAKEIERPEFRTAPFRILFCHIPLWWRSENSGCVDGRRKWHDLLVKGRIQLVISGHTHSPGWLPPVAGRPYGQLVAGGPQPQRATYIRGHVTADRFAITHYRLDGQVLVQFDVGRWT